MILAILSIIAVWMFSVPYAWAVTITVFASLEILWSIVRDIDAGSSMRD